MEQYPIEKHIKIQWNPSHLLTNQKAKQNEQSFAMPDLGSYPRVWIHVQAAFSKSNWTVLQSKLDLHSWSLCTCQEADDPGGREASSTVSPAKGLSPRAYNVSCSLTQLLCWAPVSSAPHASPAWLFFSTPFSHTGGVTLWNHRAEESRSWGNVQLAFLQATSFRFLSCTGWGGPPPTPIGSSISGPHWGLVSTEDLFSSLRGRSKEGWKGRWKCRS